MDAGIISNASIQKQWRNLVEFGKNYKKWAKNDVIVDLGVVEAINLGCNGGHYYFYSRVVRKWCFLLYFV